MREEKIAIVNRLVSKGYQLCGKSIEEMADMLSLETWQSVEKSFNHFRNAFSGE